MIFQELLHLLDSGLYGFPLCILFFWAVIDMEISVFLIGQVQLLLNRHSGDSVVTDVVDSLVFKGSFLLEHQLIHHGGHALHHDDEAVAASVHMLDVPFTEVAPVQNESDLSVAIAHGLIQHKLQLRHVIDASGIRFIKKWLLVVGVIGDGVVEDGFPLS